MTKQEIITNKKELKEWLDYEHSRYGNVSIIKVLFGLGEQAVLWKHQVLLRKAEYYTNTGNKILALYYRIRLTRLQNKHAIHIPLNTCGRGLKLMHVGPVLLNTNTILGKDCVIHMNVGVQ